jgi:hypothetical protein
MGLQKVFLLGGYDLEMMTIKQMLEGRTDCMTIDRHLSWDNAILSAYQEELVRYHKDVEIFGIELREDIFAPCNYQRIDHHNDYNDRPASVLQVAEILGITPSWNIQLVAANDAGYIPAMQALGATDEEIQKIRRQDRAAQGVTEEDELAAEQSIVKGLTRLNGMLVVRSHTSRFSAICDRLYPYRRLLIYTDREWVYYGEGKYWLVEMFAADIKAGRVYHGGGESGYIGTARDAFPKEQIVSLVNRIKQEYEQL